MYILHKYLQEKETILDNIYDYYIFPIINTITYYLWLGDIDE